MDGLYFALQNQSQITCIMHEPPGGSVQLIFLGILHLCVIVLRLGFSKRVLIHAFAPRTANAIYHFQVALMIQLACLACFRPGLLSSLEHERQNERAGLDKRCKSNNEAVFPN